MSNNIYKWSLYNIFEKDDEGTLIFNTLSKKLMLIKGESERELKRLLEQKSLESNKLIDELYRQGYVVDYLFEEKRFCDFQYYTKVFSGNVLDFTIIPTERCNFRCQYCYEEERNGFMNEGVVENLLKFLSKNLRFYKELSIDWFGGEPLLAKELIIYTMGQVKKLCRENGVVLSCIMATNGYELDLDTFWRLINSGVRSFHISLDGNKETHNMQRPHKSDADSYSKILNNLITISQKVVTNKNRFVIDVRMNVSQYNMYAVKDFLDMYERYFRDDQRFNLVWQWVRDWGGDRITQNSMKESLVSEQECTQLYEHSLSKGIKSDERLSCNSGREYCSACKLNGYVIDYDGMVYKCSMAKDKPEYRERALIGHLDSYGNLNVNEKKHSEWILPKGKMEECDICAFYPMCMGASCPLSDNIIHNKSKCMVYRSSIGQQIRNKKLYGKYEVFE